MMFQYVVGTAVVIASIFLYSSSPQIPLAKSRPSSPAHTVQGPLPSPIKIPLQSLLLYVQGPPQIPLAKSLRLTVQDPCPSNSGGKSRPFSWLTMFRPLPLFKLRWPKHFCQFWPGTKKQQCVVFLLQFVRKTMCSFFVTMY